MGTGTTPGKGKAREDREFDQTYLSTEKHGKLVHRDWIAHAMRWGFAHRFCKGKRVLDVGCGPEWNLGKVLCCHGNMGIRPEHYVGVDLSNIEERSTKYYTVRGDVDFTAPLTAGIFEMEHGDFDVVCCFEVIEHMSRVAGERLLENMRLACRDDGVVLISTPRNEGHKPARNHLHEYGTEELQACIEAAGLKVDRRFGTFGDVVKLRKAISKEIETRCSIDDARDTFKKMKKKAAHLHTFNDLHDYYSDDVLSCIFAPLYPDACKNNLWVCSHA